MTPTEPVDDDASRPDDAPILIPPPAPSKPQSGDPSTPASPPAPWAPTPGATPVPTPPPAPWAPTPGTAPVPAPPPAPQAPAPDGSREPTPESPPAPWAPLVDDPHEMPVGVREYMARVRMPVGPPGFPVVGPGAPGRIALRAWARLFDSLLIVVPSLIVAAVLWTHVGADDELVIDTIPIWAVVGVRVASFAYETIAVGLTGRTIGKWIFGLRIENPQGSRPSWTASALRALLPTSLTMVPVFGIALAISGYLPALRDPVGQHLYDRAAGTVVTSTR